MDALGKLFGSNAIVKILRLFLFNPGEAFESKDVAIRTKVSPDIVKTELAMLDKIGFIKKRSLFKEHTAKKGKKEVVKKKRVSGWTLNDNFPYLEGLQGLLLATVPLKNKDIAKRLNKIGRVKLLITAGVFVDKPDSRVDVLIVGDQIKKSQLETTIKNFEAEIGKELQYAVFSTADFQYRMGIYDRLIRDVLDYPHEVIVDRIGLS